jgi:hypothetical protein
MFHTSSCPPRLPLDVLATCQGPSSPLASLLESPRNYPARSLRLRTQSRRRCTRFPWSSAQKWDFLCTNMSLRGGCLIKTFNGTYRPRSKLSYCTCRHMRAMRYHPFYFEVLEFEDAESALLKGAHVLYPPHKLFLPHPSCQASVGHVLLKSVSNGARIIHL